MQHGTFKFFREDKGYGFITRDEGEDLILMCYTSQDFREGLDAFLNKRAPQWRGQ